MSIAGGSDFAGKMAFRPIRLLAAFCLALVPALNEAAEQRAFVVGVENVDDMPQSGVANGDYVGIGREILDAFAADNSYEFTYRPLPVRRLVRTMIKGETDFKYPDNPLWDQETKKDVPVVYSQPVARVVDASLVTPRNSRRAIGSVRRLGTIAGYTPTGWQARLRSKQTALVEFDNPETLLDGVIVGHMDAAYIGLAEAKYKLEAMGKPDALVVNRSLPFETVTYHLSSTRHPDIVEAFNGWQQGHADKIRAILAKYGAEAGD